MLAGEAFHIAASLAIAGAVIWAFDWALRNMPEALDEEAKAAVPRNGAGGKAVASRDSGQVRTSDIAHRNGVLK